MLVRNPVTRKLSCQLDDLRFLRRKQCCHIQVPSFLCKTHELRLLGFVRKDSCMALLEVFYISGVLSVLKLDVLILK